MDTLSATPAVASTAVDRAFALVMAILPATVALVVLPGSRDGYTDVKLLAITLCVGALLWCRPASLVRAARAPGGVGLAAGGLLLALLWATVTSDAPTLSLMGADDRNNGLLAYVVHLSLFAAVAGGATATAVGGAVRSLAVGAASGAAYWLLQLAGRDPLGIRPLPGAFSSAEVFTGTFGNPNFAGAFVAAALPAALWAATAAPARLRALIWTAAAVVSAVAMFGADSLQGPIAAAVGVGVLGLAWLRRHHPRGVRPAAAPCLALAALAVLGLLRVGPLGELGRQETFVSRTWDWTSAVRMARDQPLTGVGLARFRGHTRAYRPPHELRAHGFEAYADSAHSVPLDMAAGGGLPLLAAYLAFVGTVGLRLLHGLRYLHGPGLTLLGAVGGVWAAYHAQSLVSIDVSHLAVLHFLSAGGIVALTTPQSLASPVTPPTDATPTARTSRTRLARLAVGVPTLLTVLVLTAGCVAARQLRRSEEHGLRGEPVAAVAAARTAVRLAPWQAVYWSQLGYLHDWAGPDQEALRAYLQALRRDPREVTDLIAAAAAAERTNRPRLAHRLLRRALLVEPQAPRVKVLAAQAALALGMREEAVGLLQAALAFDPADPEARALLQALQRGGLP